MREGPAAARDKKAGAQSIVERAKGLLKVHLRVGGAGGEGGRKKRRATSCASRVQSFSLARSPKIRRAREKIKQRNLRRKGWGVCDLDVQIRLFSRATFIARARWTARGLIRIFVIKVCAGEERKKIYSI